jgi:hypothetical protein
LNPIKYIVLLLFFGLVSCEDVPNETGSTVPDGVELMDEATFVKVVAEAQIIESHVSVLRIYQPYYKDSVNHYYKHLFEKYNTSSEGFFYTMQEYSKDPFLMDTILTQSINLLKEMEQELGEVTMPNQSLNALSRQQIGDIVYETPIKDLMIEGNPQLAGFIRDTLFHYLDSFPEVVTDKGYSMESARFTFVLNTNSKIMFNELQEYIKGKAEKEAGVD